MSTTDGEKKTERNDKYDTVSHFNSDHSFCLLAGAYIVERYSEKHGQLTDDWVLKSVIVAVALFIPIILIVKAIL